jgi:hypothetical protein
MTAQYAYHRPDPGPEPPLRVLGSNPDVELDVPDWRYRLAGRLAADRQASVRAGVAPAPLPRSLDPLLVKDILPFLAAREEARTVADRDRLVRERPGLVWAMGVFEHARMTRYRLEAMFLGGASAADAAGVLGVEPNFVWWYERLFFDVRGHEGDARWLRDNVFVPALAAGGRDARYNVVWKIVAGLFGWKTFVAGNDDAVQPLLPGVAAGITDMVRLRTAEDACLAQVTRVINRYNCLEVVEEHHRAAEVELRRLAAVADDRIADRGEVLAALVRPILSALSVKRASAADVPVPEGPLAGIFDRRDRENAERRRRVEPPPAGKELSDDD